MLRIKNTRGDTIIEVLIAVTIAGLAIGTSYSIASKAIQNAVSARERDQAVGLLESQVSALKLRQQKTDAATFASQFDSKTNYCLNESASDPSATTTWYPQYASSTNPTACTRNGIYVLNISTAKDNTSSTPTNYRLDVRWPRVGGGSDNDTTFYYRF